MKEYLKQICDTTISNYRFATRNLRYDGDYINHYSALLNGYYKREIPYEKVKEIRKYMKNNTSKMSVFRGDILYIVSFLIALSNEDELKVCDEVLTTFDLLLDEGFKECEYLVLVAHSLVKYSTEEERIYVMKKAKHIYLIMKEKYGNLTKEDDYLLSLFLSLNCSSIEYIEEYMGEIFNYMHNLKIFSDNGVQCLTNSILLDNDKDKVEKVENLVNKLQENDIKVGQQFLQLLGFMTKYKDINEKINLMKEIIDYLCNEESEYSFYIDKDFRNMIAYVIAFFDYENNIKYVDELLAFGTYSFLLSKNQGILNEVLA